MKNGQVRVITSAGMDWKRRRIIYLLPLFIAAVVVGFLINLSTYETLKFSELRQTVVNLPRRWNQLKHGNNNAEIYGKQPIVTASTNSVVEDQTASEIEDEGTEKELEFWEQPTLLNLNFTWLVNNETLCKVRAEDPENVRIMPVLVHTARSHFDERRALRKTWGSVGLYKLWDIRFVFLLGEADRGMNPAVNQDKFEAQEKRLQDEMNEFGDLVIGSFIDSYHNLTYKHLMGYKWVLNFCKESPFVLKIDDDMFIDIMRWLSWRSSDYEKLEKDPSAVIPDLYCHTFGGTKPIREPASKWYASFEDWPEDDYPDYCSGWAYALTVDLIRKIYASSNDRRMFWVDDVFVTGALLEVAKKKFDFKPEIRHIWGEVTTDIKEYRPMCEMGTFDDKREFRAVAYVPRGELFERDMMCMWNKTLHDSRNVNSESTLKLR